MLAAFGGRHRLVRPVQRLELSYGAISSPLRCGARRDGGEFGGDDDIWRPVAECR